MRVFDLGISGHAVANALHSLSYVRGQNANENFGRLWARIQALYEELGLEHRCTALGLKNICNVAAPRKEFPNLSGISAAEVRHLVRAVHRICEERNDGLPASSHRALAMRALVAYYDELEGSGHYLNRPDKLQQAIGDFMLHYSALARLAMESGAHMWSIVPKFHYAMHLGAQAAWENPRFSQAYSGEDFVGRLSKLGHMSLTGKPLFAITAPILSKWRLGLHLRLTRL
jgi:hypothetical protein